MKIPEPKTIHIYGTNISNTNPEEVLDLIERYNFKKPDYICFPSTNVIAKAYKNKRFQETLNRAFLTLPDGKFTEIYGRMKGYQNIKTISGFWLMSKLLETDLSHFFYGVDDKILGLLKKKIETDYPNANVLGYKEPPFVEEENIEDNSIINQDFIQINQLKPDIIWIGISNIKQDFLMNHYVTKLDHGLLIGVGAVFLYMAGIVNKGPEWIKKLGLRWLVRLVQEPRKEFPKTVPSLLLFLRLFCTEVLKNIFRFPLKK